MWQYICPELVKAVDLEPENDIRSEHMHSLAQVRLLSRFNLRIKTDQNLRLTKYVSFLVYREDG